MWGFPQHLPVPSGPGQLTAGVPAWPKVYGPRSMHYQPFREVTHSGLPPCPHPPHGSVGRRSPLPPGSVRCCQELAPPLPEPAVGRQHWGSQFHAPAAAAAAFCCGQGAAALGPWPHSPSGCGAQAFNFNNGKGRSGGGEVYQRICYFLIRKSQDPC